MLHFVYNSDLRHGLKFDCNEQALLDRGAKPLTDFNAFRHYIQFIDIRSVQSTQAVLDLPLFCLENCFL